MMMTDEDFDTTIKVINLIPAKLKASNEEYDQLRADVAHLNAALAESERQNKMMVQTILKVAESMGIIKPPPPKTEEQPT